MGSAELDVLRAQIDQLVQLESQQWLLLLLMRV